MATSLLPGFKSLGGSSLRVLNEKTGDIISRRQYAKIKNAGLTNEQLAELNKLKNPLAAISRPARGRKSLIKAPPELKAQAAAKRLADEAKLKAVQKAAQAEKKISRKVETAKKKKFKRKKITGRLLKPGHLGTRIAFNDYEEYTEAYAEAKATKKIFAYGLGLNGVDERSGLPISATVFRMRAFDGLIDEDEFNDEMASFLESHSYFVFTNFFMHLAFSKEYAQSKSPKHKRK